jgi:hypothetical protein
VLSSRWAYWAGIPVSGPAFVVYLSLFLATLGADSAHGERRRLARTATIALGGLVVIAALWFGFLQYAVLRHWCRFCLATHSSAVIASTFLFSLAIRNSRNAAALGRDDGPSREIRTGLAMSLLGFAVLLGGQLLVRSHSYGLAAMATQTGRSPRQLALFNGRFALSPDDLPLIGPKSAPAFMVCLFDYTCIHCRRLHPLLKDAAARSKGQISIITLPAPLDSDCNPLIPETQPANFGACDYARLGLAVWRARPDAFREFDDWLLGSEELPPPDRARAKAEALVGRDALEEALSGRWVRDQLSSDVQLYMASSSAIRNARLPQLIFADAVAYGDIEDTEALEHLIQSHRPFARPAP